MDFWQGSSKGSEGETVKPPKPIRKTHRENHQTHETIKQVLLVKHLYMWGKTHRDEGDSLRFFSSIFAFVFFVWGCLK